MAFGLFAWFLIVSVGAHDTVELVQTKVSGDNLAVGDVIDAAVQRVYEDDQGQEEGPTGSVTGGGQGNTGCTGGGGEICFVSQVHRAEQKNGVRNHPDCGSSSWVTADTCKNLCLADQKCTCYMFDSTGGNECWTHTGSAGAVGTGAGRAVRKAWNVAHGGGGGNTGGGMGAMQSNKYCSDDWGARHGRHTKMNLESCKQKCAASSSCKAISFSAPEGNKCVICDTTTTASHPNWATSIKGGGGKTGGGGGGCITAWTQGEHIGWTNGVGPNQGYSSFDQALAACTGQCNAIMYYGPNGQYYRRSTGAGKSRWSGTVNDKWCQVK